MAARDAHGRTALMYAANEPPKRLTIGQMLFGVWDGSDALGRAEREAKAYRDHSEVVRYLLACGADLDLRDAGGKTALDIALDHTRNVGDANTDVVDALRQS